MENTNVEQMKMQTKNLADEKLEALKELFPNAVIEVIDENGEETVAIDKDILMQEISAKVVEGNEERYQFTWPDKKKSILAANAPTTKTLRPCKEESINFDTTENLYIEGDNLEVLKLLQETYLGKIKMIYIDPPYNTGKDFVYEDNFKMSTDEYMENSGQYDEEGNRLEKNLESNGRFHTDWLNMMYPRLKLARNLLSDDGVIFISIDDNEQANLREICDEVFGVKNIIISGAVIVKTEGRGYGGFSKTHDNFIVYAKNVLNLNLNKVIVKGKSFKYFDEKGGFNIKDLRNQNTKAFNDKNRPNLRYPFYVNNLSPDRNGLYEVSLEYKNGWIAIYPSVIDGIKSVWRWGKGEGEKARLNIANICAKKGEDGVIRIFEKARILDEKPKSILISKKYLTNTGTKELQKIFNKKVFDFPKPIGLIKDFLLIGSNCDSIILDFFSGSATTAHATMQLNAEDGGKRKYIMVQI
ncbi:site-specific DNA-methyltransferase, partial [Dialister micraerophilus]|uniref:site-specific DNA-methyltransferase n=1 Tax=Dialister micraerophilus TaxID=309120 RepID=UPI0023EF78C9